MMQNTADEHRDLYRSPFRLVIILAVCLFTAELTIMYLLPFVSSPGGLIAAVLAAGMLLVILSPVLYYLVLRPMIAHRDKRRQAETALAVQKNFSESLMENLSAATLVINSDHTVILWNRACEVLTGIGADEILGTDGQWRPFYGEKRPILADLIIDDKAGMIHDYFKYSGKSHCIPNGFRAEDWFENIGGRRRYIVTEAAPLYDRQGNVVAAIETVQDITDARETEENFVRISEGISLSTGDQFFRLLVASLARTLGTAFAFVGVLKENEPRVVHTVSVYAHGRIMDNFAYHLDDTPCSNVIETGICLYPQDVQKDFPKDEMLLRMGIESYAGAPVLDAEGKSMGLLVVLDSKPLEKLALISSLLQVFAMRVAAELERMRSGLQLRNMTRKLSTLIESLRAGIVFEDVDRSIALTNTTFCSLFHFSEGPEQMIGRDSRKLAKECMGKFREPVKFLQRIEELMRKREVVTNEELLLADGRIFERDYIPIVSDDGLFGHVWQYRDITERKQLETQLMQAQKMEAVGELAGGIAHDFNNILTAIIGYGNLLKMKMPADDPLHIYIENILNSSEKAANLTQSLLSFSRKQAIDPKPLNLNRVIEKTEKLLSRLIGENIRVKTVFYNSDLIVMADTVQMEQVLMNLATNARDAMPDGGDLTIEARSVYLDDEYIRKREGDKPGMFALISVTDTGTGMDADMTDNILDPFFTTKEVCKRTGPGFAIVCGIVKQHGGYIELESERGRGTTFRVLLPLIAATTEEKQSEGPAVVGKGAETILLVEDDMMVRELNRDVLERFGYTVIVASDGEEAIRKYQESKDSIQMLLLDVVLPKKSGKEIYDEIRIQNPHIKTLFISGYTDDHIHKKGISDPSINFIPKPVSPLKLLQKVRAVMAS